MAKLIVTGNSREHALERARRALDEFEIDGMPTALTFHRVVVRDPAFAPTDGERFTVYTSWIETDFDNQIEPYHGPAGEVTEPETRQKVTVEVGGKRLEVSLPEGFAASGSGGGAAAGAKAPRRAGKKKAGGAGGASGDAVVAPMQGTVVKIAVEEGQEVAEGDLVVVLEAMKMEQPLNAHKSGTVANITAEVGTTVPNGTPLLEIRTEPASPPAETARGHEPLPDRPEPPMIGATPDDGRLRW